MAVTFCIEMSHIRPKRVTTEAARRTKGLGLKKKDSSLKRDTVVSALFSYLLTIIGDPSFTLDLLKVDSYSLYVARNLGQFILKR